MLAEQIVPSESVLAAEAESSHTLTPRALLHAFLFAHGDPLPLRQLAASIALSEGIVLQILEAMAEQYLHDVDCGLQLNCIAGYWQLVTKPQLSANLAALLPAQEGYRITPAMLETLALIACRQPLSRPDIEILRGVNSDHLVRKLLLLELICDCGKRGRLTLYGTTDRFLQHFGLQSPEELLLQIPNTVPDALPLWPGEEG